MFAQMSGGERRGDVRRKVSVAGSIMRADGKERLSLVRDVSASGARLFVATRKVAPGETVRITLQLDAGVEHSTTARLLRAADVDAGIWKREIAVAFDERLPLDVTKILHAE